MKLPQGEHLIVEREKIVGYLLNARHRYGASKARFFGQFGFRVENWEQLAVVLREHGQRNEVTLVKQTVFGPRYEVEGTLSAPDGRTPRVRTVWQWDRGQLAPRLITTYPLEENQVMIKEHDIVVLTRDLPEEGLAAGDAGTVVHIHDAGAGYEVEFMTLSGRTITVTTVMASQVRAVRSGDLIHVRELQAA